MIARILMFFILLMGFIGTSQDYSEIDSKVKNYPEFSSIDHLAIRIKNDFTSDSTRVRAAFIWLTENIRYNRTLNDLFAPTPRVIYNSEYGKKYQIEKYRLKQIRKVFKSKEGVCFEYSLMLEYLFKNFEIPSKIIYGLAKTDIEDGEGKRLVKNHTWNAIHINGSWRLMDPTWAAGYFDLTKGRFVKKYLDHFFFTPPIDFAKTHFPVDSNWQLITNPIKLSSFFSAPIFFPAYFESHVKLSQEIKGVLVLSDENEYLLKFDGFLKNSNLYYRVSGEERMRKMKFKKEKNKYISKIRFRKNLKSVKYITVFNKENAILNFKLQSNELETGK